MVPEIDENASSCSTIVSQRLIVPDSQIKSRPSSKEVAETDGMSCIRKFYESRGISSDAVSVIMSSWRKSTATQYETYFKKWNSFCCRREINPLCVSEITAIEFLYELFSHDHSYSSLNTARSALSTILWNDNGLTIGKYPSVKRFLKGVFETRPPLPRYIATWDVNIVLCYLKTFSRWKM